MSSPSFKQLGLPVALNSALNKLGYETPTPIQQQSIPVLLQGKDLLAQADTGTGKTAAFALPSLAQVNLKQKTPQILVLAPTRELAIQVAEAMQAYGREMDGFKVVSIYGGQDYSIQIRALKRGVHAIVSTPGRLMDHMRRGTVSIESVKMVVLDEADEMLKMGFVEDITWILDHVPEERQTALFSATMPAPIKKISSRYLQNPEHIFIKAKKESLSKIEQFYCCVKNDDKLEATARFLEIENCQAAMIFTRTKNSTVEVAERLQARGFSATALNGDMAQAARKNVIERIKANKLDIIVATDVAARGIDVERVSHVINYDMPYDTETYIHRIGRTGRAGRSGTAILLVTARERRLLNTIEKAVNKPVKELKAPSVAQMQQKREDELLATVMSQLAERNTIKAHFTSVEHLLECSGASAKEIAAALLSLLRADGVDALQEIATPKADKAPAKRRRSGGGRSASKESAPRKSGRGKPSDGRSARGKSTRGKPAAGRGKPSTHKGKKPAGKVGKRRK